MKHREWTLRFDEKNEDATICSKGDYDNPDMEFVDVVEASSLDQLKAENSELRARVDSMQGLLADIVNCYKGDPIGLTHAMIDAEQLLKLADLKLEGEK